MGVLRDELASIPSCISVVGCGVMQRRVKLDELYSLQPSENYPQHVVVGLCTQGECVLAEVEGCDLCEVEVDEVLVIACFIDEEGRGGLELSSVVCHGRECCGDLRTHYRRCPIDSFRPGALRDCEEVRLHDVEGIQESDVGRRICAGVLEDGCCMVVG